MMREDDLEEEESELFKKRKDHSDLAIVTNSPVRRKMIHFIGSTGKTIEEVAEEFKLEQSQARYHLSMLEKSDYIANEGDKIRLTDRGAGFISNVKK